MDCSPVDIKTIFDLFWWCNFCFKWQDVDSRMIFTFSETSQWGSTISFFNTDDFQKWSIVNHDVKHGGTWKTYKQPAKDYINKYNPAPIQKLGRGVKSFANYFRGKKKPEA